MKKCILCFCLLLLTCVVYGARYTRVISLASAMTQNIYYLGSGDRLVGCTSYCVLPEGEEKEIVASAITVNIEQVVALKPDLVIATQISRTEDIELLRKFNIRVEVFPTPNSFDEICQQFVTLGRLLDLEDTAQRLISTIQGEVAQLRERGATLPSRKVFFQLGADPLFTVLPNTFMNDYILFAHATNIAEGMTKGTISRERVIAANPDFIFVVDMGVIGDREVSIWKNFSELQAVRNKHIFVIDADMACTQTPFTFLQTMRLVLTHMGENL